MWLYGKAMVISTNSWMSEVQDDGEKAWLTANSEVLTVTAPMYIEKKDDAQVCESASDTS